jgi:hypothetical protein
MLSTFLNGIFCLPVEEDASEYEYEYENSEIPEKCLTTNDSTDPNKPCIFPFKFNDVVYEGCPTDLKDKNKRWCSTESNENNVENSEKWGYCSGYCPIELEEGKLKPDCLILILAGELQAALYFDTIIEQF